MAKRSKSGSAKPTSKPRNRKTRADVPGGDAATPGPGHNSDKPSRLTPKEEQELFMRHRTAWNAHQARQKALDEQRKDLVAALKSDGFLLDHMKIADDFATVKGEKRQTDNVRRRLQVARWLNHPMGAQFDLFEQPDRTPLADRAFEEGRMASMQNQPRKCDYAPETEAYRRFMDGYSDHQSKLMSDGFKKPAAEDDAAAEEIDPNAPVPRDEFRNRLSQATAAVNEGVKNFRPN